MKKLLSIAIVSLALAACGGKTKPESTMENSGGTMGGAKYGGGSYGGATYGNPCAANPCAPK